MLRVGLEVARTGAEGPGMRYAVWLQGCPLRCPGCCNPHLLPDTGGTDVSVDELANRIAATNDIEGVTLLGGEPFAQSVQLAELLQRVRALGLSTMAFSGFTLDELREQPNAPALIHQLDLLVDGPYERELPDTTRRWIGSRNQVMHFLTDRYSPDDPCFTDADTVEIRLVAGTLTVNGRPWGSALGRKRRKLS